jgi:hypothetical protein
MYYTRCPLRLTLQNYSENGMVSGNHAIVIPFTQKFSIKGAKNI